MLGWLRNRLQEYDMDEVTINLWVVSFKIGRTKPLAPTTKPIDHPKPSAPEPEPDVDRDLPTDPLLADEPELRPSELEKPISLVGTRFEQQLRANQEVADSLKHKGDAYVASKAVTFYLDGFPKGTDDERSC